MSYKELMRNIKTIYTIFYLALLFTYLILTDKIFMLLTILTTFSIVISSYFSCFSRPYFNKYILNITIIYILYKIGVKLCLVYM